LENPAEHEFAYSYEACKAGLCNVTENVPMLYAVVREEFWLVPLTYLLHGAESFLRS